MSEIPPQKKLARWLGCLIKGPLGCLAFFAGAGIVLVLFLPPALGRLTDRSLEEWFNENHMGSLEIGETWLGSLYGPQHVKSLILRDPSGEEIVRAELEGPSLGPVIFGEAQEYGPVGVRVHRVNLIEHEDGTTNLARALAHRGAPTSGAGAELSLSRKGLYFKAPLPIHFELAIDRWSSASAGAGRGLLENMTFTGTLFWHDDERSLELDGGTDPATLEPFRLKLSASESARERARPWDVALDAENVPSSFADVLAGAAGLLGEIHGPRIDAIHAQWSSQRDELAIEELTLHSAQARIELSGSIDRERRALVGDADERARVELAPDLPWASAVLADLFPMVSAIRPLVQGERISIAATDFFLPLAGGSELRARCEVLVRPSSWILDPALARALGSEPAPELWNEEDRACFADVAGPGTTWAELALPSDKGPLRFSGAFDRAERTYRNLVVELPAGLVPGREGAFVIDGPHAEPLVSAAAPR